MHGGGSGGGSERKGVMAAEGAKKWCGRRREWLQYTV